MLIHLQVQATRNVHGIGVHGSADQELVVLEVGDDLLGETLGTLLELLDLVLAGTVLGHGLLDLLHVGCKVVSVFVRPSVAGDCSSIHLRWPR